MTKTVKITIKGFIQVFKGIFTINVDNIQGRASRFEYWFFHIVLISALLIVLFFTREAKDELKLTNDAFVLAFIPFIVLLLLSIIPVLCLIIRRLHDINLSGIFIIFYLIPIICLIYFIFFVSPSQEPYVVRYGMYYILPYNMYHAVYYIINTGLPYVNIIFNLVLFLKAGTKGPNKYGLNPYEIKTNIEQIQKETKNNIEQTQQETIETENIPLEEILPINETNKIAGERIEIEKTEEAEKAKKQVNLFDPNKPSYKV